MKTFFSFTLICTLLITLVSCNNPKTSLEENSGENQNTQKIEESTEESTQKLIMEEVLQEDIIDGPSLIDTSYADEAGLSEYEVQSLIHIREEEKLARDVYLTLYETWGQRIFSNIAQSEQTHTDAVKTLLNTYSINDPVTDDTVGVFQIPEMQTLYDSLTAQGNLSLADALIVGATIEDLDIYDIQEFRKNIANEDILRVYENLERGSRNHMRAFTKNLVNLGLTYTPSYISEEEYNAIISSEQERGNRGHGGGGNGFGGGR